MIDNIAAVGGGGGVPQCSDGIPAVDGSDGVSLTLLT